MALRTAKAWKSRTDGYFCASRHWVCRLCGDHTIIRQPNCARCESDLFWLFDSTAEYVRYTELRFLEKAGEIYDLRPKVNFPLVLYNQDGQAIPLKNSTGGWLRTVPRYECDFAYYRNGTEVWIVEDVKSPNPKGDDPVFKCKARIFSALYGFEITVVRRS